ncbi:MAG: hypothetical protein ACK4SL_00015 [Candidatus Paceibacteria bacterium]
MGQIQFQDESITRRAPTRASTGFARKLIAWGIVKTERQANVFLLLLVVIAGAITTYNILSLTKTPPPPVLNEQVTPV